ncbi:hypothetical protein BOX15_Mlig021253g1 [Macrostomum lignano]|uniref:Protein kinase domain-containing protein n=1 Tax=Macrostomum lignano TaxID=282301 RepID=A0A267EMK1_9PLAT|nr:hypothetical protein BOX15_Mlig021253g1 [Macrostomum lignano]
MAEKGGGQNGVDQVASAVSKMQLQQQQQPLISGTQSAVDWQKFSLRQAELLRTVGTGTFGRVMVIRDKTSGEYFALKILIIEDVMRLKQVEHVKNEKSILKMVNHPFLVSLFWTNHDVKFLYMIFDFVCGGEIFSYLRTAGTFSNSSAQFYSAEILTAVIYLHDLSVVYRDLKPENLLLDTQGHLKITDFGFAKVLKDRTYTMCGTPEYLAPEIIQGKGYNRAVDYWALGF